MARLGGGVVHALMGAALWEHKPGIVALVGQGLPDASVQTLKTNLDTRGLVTLDIPQIRAWQLFEDDGSRRELYRVKITEPFIMGAQPEHLPAAYRQAPCTYLLQDANGLRAWRKILNGLILWEPLQQVMTPEHASAIRNVLRTCHIDIISPNLIEAQAVYGILPPEQLVKAMLDDGAHCVALRMGAEGSIVANAEGEFHVIKPVQLQRLVDQTGAGNTYCGGFLAGFAQGKTLQEAGVMGAVSASFCLEQVGVFSPSDTSVLERDSRFSTLISD